MNSPPLSESIPKRGKGSRVRICSKASKTLSCALFLTACVLSPAGQDIGHIESLAEVPTGVASIMGHQINFTKILACSHPSGHWFEPELGA